MHEASPFGIAVLPILVATPSMIPPQPINTTASERTFDARLVALVHAAALFVATRCHLLPHATPADIAIAEVSSLTKRARVMLARSRTALSRLKRPGAQARAWPLAHPLPLTT